jgi:hypothetical protein
MFKTFVIALSGLGLAACAMHSDSARPQSTVTLDESPTVAVESAQPIPSLSPKQCEELIRAGNEMAMKGGAAPEPISRLKPLEVYDDRGNIIIALRRSIREEQGRRVCYEEQGYCVEPGVSSYIPTNDEHWTFRPLDSRWLYEYVWKK